MDLKNDKIIKSNHLIYIFNNKYRLMTNIKHLFDYPKVDIRAQPLSPWPSDRFELCPRTIFLSYIAFKGQLKSPPHGNV